jgi:hypothetical protein
LESMSGEESFERVGASNVPMGGRAPFPAQFELGADDKHKWEGRSDEWIKRAVMTALHWDLAVPRDRVQVRVDEVDALMVPGVAEVTNRIVFFEGD